MSENEKQEDDKESIYFYSTRDGKYGFFSNFWRAQILYKGKKYPTSEHFFQSMKFSESDPDWAESIRLAPNPMKAAQMGRNRRKKLNIDIWEFKKIGTMALALKLKFGQHPNLKEKLLETGEKTLVEHTKKDSFWADGGDGSGKNMLGKLLMELREEYINEKIDKEGL